jgi:OFA family oxalate/formate antiporter-like MFS transporter
MQKKSIGFGSRGTILLIYQVLAYAGYTAFTNFPQNVMSQYYGGTTTTTLMNLIGSIVGYIITYFIVSPRIGRLKSVKNVGIIIGLISLVFCAMICIVPPTNIVLWCLFFVLVLITTQLWACFFVTLIIGNWFPRRKGTVMGIVTMAFPIVTGICLNLFMIQYGMSMAKGMTLVQANLAAFSPYWILSLVGIIICAIFLKDFPEQVGAYRDNDKSFTAEMANQMLAAELEARKKSVWKRSKIWGCKDWWLMAIPNSLLLSCAIAFMVQIIPVLMRYNDALSVLAVPGFVLMSQGYSAVLFGLSIFACFGSWLLGVLDTKYGTKTAVFITAILMLAAGLVGIIDNPWAAVAACWLLGLFMGASSNFGLSAIVRYWRQEDFPSVYSGAPPLGTVVGAAFPFIIASIAARFTYNGAFLFVAIMAVVCIVSICLFNPRGIIKYDNKLREAAGLPIDDVLEQRLIQEKAGRKAEVTK